MKKDINIRKILHIIGGLLILEAFFMLIPMLTSYTYDEPDWIPFGISAFATFVIGYFLRHIHTESSRLSKRDGFLLTTMVWIAFCIFGMIPFMLCSSALGFSSAFFEAMSAFSTTGATTIVNSPIVLSKGVQIWQAILQWLGGMGIIVLTIAVIPAFNTSGGIQMFNAEVTGITHDKLSPRINRTALALWSVYFALTMLLVGLLWLGPMDLFDSVCHAFGTISTGGFSNRINGIASYNSDYVMLVTTIFMFLGGMNFAMIFRAVIFRWKPISMNQTIRTYIGTILLFSLMFSLSNIIEGNVESWQDIVLIPLFQVVSTITSTGYIASGFYVGSPIILALMFMMMFSGGCAGSTSGGAKIDRLIYLKKYLSNELRRCIHPNSILSVRINGVAVNSDLVAKTISFLCLFALLIVGGGTILSLIGLPTVDSFFSAFSCICNTGIDASITGYGDDFTTIPNAAKWVLSFLMLAGRLEIYTVLVLFSHSFWRR